MPDQLSSLYSEFLEGGYDCVDRVVLNAYFSMGPRALATAASLASPPGSGTHVNKILAFSKHRAQPNCCNP